MTNPNDKFQAPTPPPERLRIFQLAERGREILEDEQRRRIERIANHLGRYPIELEILYKDKFGPDDTVVVTDREYEMMLAPFEHPDMPDVVAKEIIPDRPLDLSGP